MYLIPVPYSQLSVLHVEIIVDTLKWSGSMGTFKANIVMVIFALNILDCSWLYTKQNHPDFAVVIQPFFSKAEADKFPVEFLSDVRFSIPCSY